MSIRVEPQAEPILGYKLLERLGGGGFGEVWKVEAPGGLLKAIKIVHGDMETAGGESQKADQELKALKRVITVRHPYILSLERFDIVDGRLLIVMELADRNLADRAKECRQQGLPGIPREELLRYMAETAEALDLMNVEYQLQHLDVKPQNLFLVHNHIKVADFGLVKDLQDRMAATITGGVTPVYAAPETFDGWVSRFCDQYSLAIVYQELLTGHRPFTATNVHQLVMQHVQGKPNLDSLAPEDRVVIARALAKNPDDRFPSCKDLVDALQRANAVPAVIAPEPVLPKTERPDGDGESAADGGFSTTLMPALRAKLTSPPPGSETGPSKKRGGGSSPSITGTALAAHINPDGDLVPALVIGLGHLGLVALSELTRQITSRFGSVDAIPQTRLLGIDTDSYSLPSGAPPKHDDDSSLHRRDVVIAKLNRAGYYLNPRNGRTRIDTWFDVNMLFRIRREPITGGMRALGRLALFGHYRVISARLQAELAAIMDPQAWATAAAKTGLTMRTSQPRVYIITSLAGGTGSGMFIDLAYVLRHQLESLGYPNANVVGMFLLPASNAESSGTLPLGNAYAALTELQHFSVARQHGLAGFSARYDEREPTIVGSLPPFTRCVFLPGKSEEKDAEVPARLIGECLAHELTTRLGRACESARPTAASMDPVYRSFGLYRCTWPRRQMLQGASQRLCAQLVQRWLSKDANKTRQEHVAALVQEKWTKHELGAETLIARFQEACSKVLGKETETALREITDPLLVKNRQLKEADRDAVQEALGGIDAILGQPSESAVLHRPSAMDDVLKSQTESLTAEWQQRLERFTIRLIECPEFRLVGADEAAKQTGRLIEQVLTHHEPLSQELTKNALKASERLRFLVANFPGIFKNRRPEQLLKELTELLANYPKWRFQSLILRRVIYTFTGLRGFLSDQVRELGFYRLRLGELTTAFQTPRHGQADRLVAHGEVIYPSGCNSLSNAVDQIVPRLSPEELATLDSRVQTAIEQQFGSLRHICTTPSLSLKGLESAMLTQAEAFVCDRLPESNIVDVYLGRHPTEAEAQQNVREALVAAAPPLADSAPAETPEMTFVGVPAGEEPQFRRFVTDRAVQVIPLPTTDELFYYRETGCDVGQIIEYLGPAAEEAYQQLVDTEHFTPHTRTDIDEWYDLRNAPRPHATARAE